MAEYLSKMEDEKMKEKYIAAFVNAFGCDESIVETMKYQDSENWDSIGHMNLIAELEDTFDIMFDTDDILAFDSYKKGIEILEHYGVEV